jgi:hypothetical protein
MSITRRIFLLIGSALFVGLVAALLLVVPMRTAANDTTSAAPAAATSAEAGSGLILPIVNLDGKWAEEKNGSSFNATIINDAIVIELGSDDTSVVYWAGTIDSYTSKGAQITSHVDTTQFVMSQDSTKVFSVNDDTLSFPFQAFGVKTTVVLHHA